MKIIIEYAFFSKKAGQQIRYHFNVATFFTGKRQSDLKSLFHLCCAKMKFNIE